MNASMWAGLRARLVLPDMNWKQFPPSVKKVSVKNVVFTDKRLVEMDMFDGTITHLMREGCENLHDRHLVGVTCGSLEKETAGPNPHSGAYDNLSDYAAKNGADLETDSLFASAYRNKEEGIPHARNNWMC
jgi:hypothetical protein